VGAFVVGIVLWNVETSEMSSVLVDDVDLEVRHQCTVIVRVESTIGIRRLSMSIERYRI